MRPAVAPRAIMLVLGRPHADIISSNVRSFGKVAHGGQVGALPRMRA